MITFILFTYNEERRIEDAIRNFIEYGEVILMDGGSTDRTEEIAKSLGAKFLTRPPTNRPFVENQENLDFIKKHITTDYIYWGYVDNAVPLHLLDHLASIAAKGRFKQVFIPMWTHLNGDTIHIANKSRIACFFHKDYIDFSTNKIHGFGKFTGSNDEIIELEDNSKLAIRHLSLYSEEKFVNGYLRYARMEAAQKFADGENFSMIKTLAAMIGYIWIYRRLAMQGRIGILTMLNQAFGRLMTYTILFEIENNLTLESMQVKYDTLRSSINSNEDYKD